MSPVDAPPPSRIVSDAAVVLRVCAKVAVCCALLWRSSSCCCSCLSLALLCFWLARVVFFFFPLDVAFQRCFGGVRPLVVSSNLLLQSGWQAFPSLVFRALEFFHVLAADHTESWPPATLSHDVGRSYCTSVIDKSCKGVAALCGAVDM